MGKYRSVASQTLHYMSRPHTTLPVRPIEAPSAWKNHSFSSTEEWIHSLTETEISEISTALKAVKNSGLSMQQLTSQDFPLPTLSKKIRQWREIIMNGRGFVVLRGFPVSSFSTSDCETIFWCLGHHLGTPGTQNSQGDLLTHVLDEGSKNADTSRLYKTSSEIAYHCDTADCVGLMCLQNAKQGGRSRIASSVSVFNEFLKRHSDKVTDLFSTVFLDVRGENGLDYIPLPPLRYDGSHLRTFYHSDYFRSAKRYPEIQHKVEKYEPVLDLYEQIAKSPELYLEMDLLPGDMQFISNHTIIHARTAYVDSNQSQKRHLLRLWISIPQKQTFPLKVRTQLSKIKLLKSLIAAKLRRQTKK